MKTMIPMLVMGVALMTGACQKEDALAPVPMKSGDEMSIGSAEVADVYWMLTQINGEVLVPSDQTLPWFMLSMRNDVTGSTGCNELMGSCRRSGDQLFFGSLSHTQRFCADLATLEDRYLQMLSNTDNFRLEHDQLTLMQGEQPLATFTAR